MAKWWTLFGDATLDRVVERAIASNLDYKAALTRIRQSRASRGIAEGGLWPRVDTGASYRRSQTSGGSGARDLFTLGLDAAWELDVFGGQQRDIEAAEANIRAAHDAAGGVLVSLVAEVALNYIDLRTAQAQASIARENLETQRRSLDLTRRKQAAGLVSKLDVTSAESQVASTEASIPVYEAATTQAIYNLDLLVGELPSTLKEALLPGSPTPVTPPEIPMGVPSDLLRRRPDVRRAEANAHAATARVGVATADLFPKFSLTGSLGVSSEQLSSLTNWSNRYWSIGPQISWPLFDAGRIRSNIELQKALRDETVLVYRQAILTAFNETHSSLNAIARERARRAALERAADASRRSVELANSLYSNGRTDYLNVLAAERSLHQAQDALAQNDQSLASSVVRLYKALGGGWSPREIIDE